VLSDDVSTNDRHSAPASYALNTDASNGTVSMNSDGTFTYTPNADYNGPDSFTYDVTDVNGDTETVNVNLTVDSVVDIADDTQTTDEDTSDTVDVLANDTFEGTPSVSAVTQPANGSVTNNNGTVTYTPDADYNGPDSYTYTVTSGGVTETATVDVTVDPVNDPPVANNDNFTTDEDTISGPIDLLGNDSDVDGDTLTVESIAGTNLTGNAQTIPVPNGTVNVSDNGTVTFTPDADYNGPVSFDYVVSDGNGGTDTGTVNGNVTSVNDTPVANNDSFTVDEDTTLSDDVSGNDTGLGDAPVTYSVAAGDEPTNGTVNMNADGTFDYTPDADFNGSDSFTYTVTDDDGDSATATANITVVPVDDTGDTTAPGGDPEVDGCIDRRNLGRGQKPQECPFDSDISRGGSREELDRNTGRSGTHGDHRDSDTARRDGSRGR
jgi:hypothetical protein